MLHGASYILSSHNIPSKWKILKTTWILLAWQLYCTDTTSFLMIEGPQLKRDYCTIYVIDQAISRSISFRFSIYWSPTTIKSTYYYYHAIFIQLGNINMYHIYNGVDTTLGWPPKSDKPLYIIVKTTHIHIYFVLRYIYNNVCIYIHKYYHHHSPGKFSQKSVCEFEPDI